MIVKVQLPLDSNLPLEKAPALLYDQTRRFEMYIPVTDYVREQMKERPKAFFEIDLSQGEPIFVKEVPDPGW